LGTKPLSGISKSSKALEALSVFYQSAGEKTGNLSDKEVADRIENLNALGVSDIMRATVR
jgi:hypothetical protein